MKLHLTMAVINKRAIWCLVAAAISVAESWGKLTYRPNNNDELIYNA